MRGNPGGVFGPDEGERSIPAHAGQPRGNAKRACSGRVYPRACGATSFYDMRVSAMKGLSPRMRGNPDDVAERMYG